VVPIRRDRTLPRSPAIRFAVTTAPTVMPGNSRETRQVNGAICATSSSNMRDDDSDFK